MGGSGDMVVYLLIPLQVGEQCVAKAKLKLSDSLLICLQLYKTASKKFHF
jgi:hypothetical protein